MQFYKYFFTENIRSLIMLAALKIYIEKFNNVYKFVFLKTKTIHLFLTTSFPALS